MAINTYGVTLKWGTTATALTKKIDIKDFPDLGGAPEQLETTTLSDPMQMFINGIQTSSAMEFTGNFTKADFNKVKTDAGKKLFYALEFGDAGSEGIFTWTGEHDVWVVGSGVNTVVEMKMSIAVSSKPKLKE